MRVFHVSAEHFAELDGWPAVLPADGFIWIGSARREFEVQTVELQQALHRRGMGSMVDLPLAHLLNNQLPSHFDYTSRYDLLITIQPTDCAVREHFVQSSAGQASTTDGRGVARRPRAQARSKR